MWSKWCKRVYVSEFFIVISSLFPVHCVYFRANQAAKLWAYLQEHFRCRICPRFTTPAYVTLINASNWEFYVYDKSCIPITHNPRFHYTRMQPLCEHLIIYIILHWNYHTEPLCRVSSTHASYSVCPEFKPSRGNMQWMSGDGGPPTYI
jgi:hypothetical protein